MDEWVRCRTVPWTFCKPPLPTACHLCRVWPGGLNMARTIGDAEAGAAVAAEPEVCVGWWSGVGWGSNRASPVRCRL